MPQRLVVGITGATGAIYAHRLLQRARALGAETHLVVTPAGVLNLHHELGLERREIEALKKGMEVKAVEFIQRGAEVYHKV